MTWPEFQRDYHLGTSFKFPRTRIFHICLEGYSRMEEGDITKDFGLCEYWIPVKIDGLVHPKSKFK